MATNGKTLHEQWKETHKAIQHAEGQIAILREQRNNYFKEASTLSQVGKHETVNSQLIRPAANYNVRTGKWHGAIETFNFSWNSTTTSQPMENKEKAFAWAQEKFAKAKTPVLNRNPYTDGMKI